MADREAVCNALNSPIELNITQGQDADITQAQPLLKKIAPDAVRADTAYDADNVINTLIERETTPCHSS
ncbi:transposase [Neokomagataea thailandica]|uniref:transposase n=1 Tax=Neokomagataea TaxID=1223423 RepID=UPI0012ECEC75